MTNDQVKTIPFGHWSLGFGHSLVGAWFYRLRLVVAAQMLFAAYALAAPPKVDYLFPPGAARGSSTQITANGSFGNWPVRVWTSGPGITAEADKEKGKFRITVSDHVTPGVHWLRFMDKEGASSPRPFVIGMIPEVEEVEPNDVPETPHRISDRLTINGRLARNGDVDCFAVDLRAGQTLVAAIEANAELAAPMDAVVQLCLLAPNRSATKDGISDAFVLEQIDDCVGLDPRLAYSVTRDGSYLVRVFSFPKEPNSTIGFAGGENFIYRLTLTTGPFINVARPSAIQRGKPAVIALDGWNLRDSMRRVVVVPPAAANEVVTFHAEMASLARLAVVDYPVLNYDSPAVPKPKDVTLPIIISGNLQTPRQRDEFAFDAKKGEKIRAQVASRMIGFAVDPVLAITDAAGKSLAENDDGGGSRRSRRLDPELEFTIPDDGKYHVVVRDVHGQASARHVYRLTLDKASADFELSVNADAFVATAGKPLEIPLTIDRQDGFSEQIQFTVEGLPTGLTAVPVASEKEGGSAKSVKLVINAAADATEWHGPITIVGATSGERPLKRAAMYKLADFDRERSDVFLTLSPRS
jgi:hypothetical protein